MTLRAFVAVFALFVLTAAAAPRDAMVVSTAWLAERLDDPRLVILHVGQPDNYTRHIPGARLVRLSDISVSSDDRTLEMLPANELRSRLAGLGIGNRSRIVVYTADQIQQATRVIFTLDAAGLGARTMLLDGGLAAWEREGRPLTADVPKEHVAKLAPLRMKKGVVVDNAFVSAHATRRGYAVIDARLPEFYSGAQIGGSKERPHKAGHIPGARNVPISALTDDKKALQSPAALKAAFDKAGVKRGDTVMVYCHIGQQASAVLFAARTLGYKAVLYDGSFEDWSRRDLPVEKTPQ